MMWGGGGGGKWFHVFSSMGGRLCSLQTTAPHCHFPPTEGSSWELSTLEP